MPKVPVGRTTMSILDGSMDLTAWSDEELMRGQRRSKRGTWEGRPPRLVPKAIHDELVRRKMSKAHDILRDSIVRAAEVLREILDDKNADAAVRLKAAGMLLDRGLGKATERVEISLASPIEEDLEFVTTYDDSEIIDVESQDVRRSLRGPENG